MNKKLLIIALALVVLAGVGFATVKAYADDSQGPRSTIIEKLVERFGLNQDEVEQVFNEVREERQAQRQARWEERLNALVQEGKITEDQKAAIIAKHEEMRAEKEANMDAWKDLSPEERHAKREEYRDEMDILGPFFDTCCEFGPKKEVKNKDFYSEYETWCEQESEKPISKKAFSLRMKERGFIQKRTGRDRIWLGVSLRSCDTL